MNFADRLEQAVRQKKSPTLVGLDPHLDLLPPEFGAVRDPQANRADVARDVADFLCSIVEVVADLVPAVKPQSAFFEELGADGALAWERVVRTAHAHELLVIGDVKRGDIGSTASAYARAFFGGRPWSDRETSCDAITVNPLLGSDSVRPFLDACREHDVGIYVLVRTSNPSSAELQTRAGDDGRTLSDTIADAVVSWGSELIGTSGLSAVGAVVGATHRLELERLRERMPRTPFLIPGFGAQGGGADDVRGGFLPGGRGALVNSSRGILYAYQKSDKPWRDAAREAVEQMNASLR